MKSDIPYPLSTWGLLGLLEYGWLSNYLGKLVSKTPWTTGNLVWPIVIVSQTLKSTNAKQSREQQTNCLCVSPTLCRCTSVHVHTHTLAVWACGVSSVWDVYWWKGHWTCREMRQYYSVCSFRRLTTICSEAWERPLHTCLACCRWWRDLGTHPPMKTASRPMCCMQRIQATAKPC